jgi:diguanylate cyclase (GGDEF)-like protein
VQYDSLRDGPAAAGSLDARQRAELDALHETTVDLIERIDLDSVLDTVVTRAAVLAGTEDGYLSLRDELDPGLLSVRIGTGAFADAVGASVREGEGLTGRVLASGSPLAVRDYRQWDASVPVGTSLPIRACVGVPLHHGEKVIGVIGLAHRSPDRQFDHGTIALLTRFAQLAAVAIDNARLHEQAQTELRERRATEDELQLTVAGLQRSQHRLYLAQAEMIERLANAAELRSTGELRNAQRMSYYAALLARRLDLPEEHCERIRIATPLHDIGKIAIPDTILLKPGLLTPDERTVVERHAEIGHELLAGSSSEMLDLAAMIALTHHERYDGTGYPYRLAGETIPIEGRIASIADVFDALTSDRPYRPAMSHEEAIAVMREGQGVQFDPLMLDLFLDALTRSGVTHSRSLRERLRRPAPRLRRRTPERFPVIPPGVLLDASRGAIETLEREVGEREPIDAALSYLHDATGHRLCVSVYVLDGDRLWLVAQRGYTGVRDGFALSQGVMARAVRTGATQFVPDVTLDPDFIGAVPRLRSEVAVPFGDGESGACGVFNIESVDSALPPEAATAFAPLAERLGGRVEELRAGLGLELTQLALLCVHVSALRGTGAIAEFVTRTISRMLGFDAAQLNLSRDEATSTLTSYWRRPESDLEPLQSELGRLLEIERSTSAAAYDVIDMAACGIVPADRESSWVTLVPLRVAGREIGVIAGQMAGPLAAERDRIEAALLFAQHGAAVLDVAIALSRESRAAVTDSLTGLLNRRGFDERIRAEIEASERSGQPFALLLADCDDLKLTNDSGGHELGDRVLQTLANTIRSQKRADDVAARIGGDEFALLLLDTDRAGARTASVRLERELRVARAALEIPLSATIGIAAYPADGASPSDLLRIADAELYVAKGEDDAEAAAKAAGNAA